MKREIKNNGEYVEVEVSEVLSKQVDLEAAEIIVLNSVRLEFAGSEKRAFIELVKHWRSHLMDIDSSFSNDMTDDQRADVIFRKMLLGEIKEMVKKNVPDRSQINEKSL